MVAREAVTLPSVPVTVTLCVLDGDLCDSEQTSFFGPAR